MSILTYPHTYGGDILKARDSARCPTGHHAYIIYHMEHFFHPVARNRTRALLYMGPHFGGVVWQVSLPHKPTRNGPLLPSPPVPRYLPRHSAPLVVCEMTGVKGAACSERKGVFYVAENVSGLMLVSPSAPVGRVIKVRSLVVCVAS